MEDLLIVINTCQGYFDNIKRLVAEISSVQINNNNVLIVSGQEPEADTSCIDGVKVLKVSYTGLHHTGAIYICEHIADFPQYNYFLLLPDTIKLGPNFHAHLERYYAALGPRSHVPVMSLINPRVRPSMDMCIASKPHLVQISDYLKRIKQDDVSTPALVRLKRQLIFDENMILGIGVKSRHATRFRPVIKEGELVSIVNTRKGLRQKRIDGGKVQEVYIIPLDLYKYQRNFKGPHTSLVLELQ